MNNAAVQGLLDRLSVTSPQRLVSVASAVAAIAAASWLTTLAAGSPNVGLPLLSTVFAVTAIARPDSHVGLVTVALVIGQWLFTVDDATTGLAIAVACCLYLFHVAVSLMSVTPISATLSREIVGRWARRSLVVALAVGWTWLTVAVLDDRRGSGSVALTAVALVALTALVLVARARVVTSGSPR